MLVPVRYRCPRCRTVATLQRAPVLADKSVTSFPLEGWVYADIDFVDSDDPGDDEAAVGTTDDGAVDPYDGADGVRIVCGEGEIDGDGCGEPYFLNFVRFVRGRAVEPDSEPEPVELARPGRVRRPRWPGGPGR